MGSSSSSSLQDVTETKLARSTEDPASNGRLPLIQCLSATSWQSAPWRSTEGKEQVLHPSRVQKPSCACTRFCPYNCYGSTTHSTIPTRYRARSPAHACHQGPRTHTREPVRKALDKATEHVHNTTRHVWIISTAAHNCTQQLHAATARSQGLQNPRKAPGRHRNRATQDDVCRLLALVSHTGGFSAKPIWACTGGLWKVPPDRQFTVAVSTAAQILCCVECAGASFPPWNLKFFSTHRLGEHRFHIRLRLPYPH